MRRARGEKCALWVCRYLAKPCGGLPERLEACVPKRPRQFRRDPRKPHTTKNHRRKIHRWFCSMSMGAELLPEAVSKHPEPWRASRLGNVTQYTCDTVLSKSPVRGTPFLFCRGVKPAVRRGGQNLAVCGGRRLNSVPSRLRPAVAACYVAPLAAATKAYRLALSWRVAGVGASRSNPQYSSVALPRRTTARGEARVLS